MRARRIRTGFFTALVSFIAVPSVDARLDHRSLRRGRGKFKLKHYRLTQHRYFPISGSPLTWRALDYCLGRYNISYRADLPPDAAPELPGAMVILCRAHGDWIADRIGILAASRNGTQMARKQEITHTPKSSKRSHTGYEKMQMSHARMRKDIKRILEERAKTEATGKPKHQIR